ncbi:MAG: TlpA family protein disulfide reductase [Aureispira sp.]|nr:TlpA family protein disulfide reductase [Aureispira sp.]
MRIIYLALILTTLLACNNSTKPNNNTVSNTAKGEKEFQEYLDRKAKKYKGKAAKDITVTTLDGKTLQLSKLKGKVVLLSFWFMACKPCITEIPSLTELQSKYGEKDFVLLAISTDQEDRLRSFVEGKALKYSVIADGKTHADRYDVSTFPSNFLIDKKGIIREVFIGGSDWNATQTYMEVKPHLEDFLTE